MNLNLSLTLLDVKLVFDSFKSYFDLSLNDDVDCRVQDRSRFNIIPFLLNWDIESLSRRHFTNFVSGKALSVYVRVVSQ